MNPAQVRNPSSAPHDGATWLPIRTLLPSATPGLYAVRVQTSRAAYAARFQLR